MDARVIISTVNSGELGENIISTLVEERLIACGNLLPKGVSIYRWQGKVEREEEFLLLMKTTAARLKEAKIRYIELHPYEVPELLVITPSDGAESYLAWIAENVS
ncbi:MAG: divalent-cation tolerance protein CutA [Bdellovibrionales bacterium]|nr:divalent-cation tolerance protein CutA [Bdellovibrionales bacterium]